MADAWEIVVAAGFEGERIDRFLRRAGRAGSRKALTTLLECGAIRVNGARTKKGQRVQAGDRVTGPTLQLDAGAEPDPNQALDVLYEDERVVVVNKPAGVPSHALRPGERGTLASALVARYPEMVGVGYRPLEPGILHRLDTDTSGALLAARDANTFDALVTAHRNGEFDKRYLALCSGRLRAPQHVHGYLAADRRKVRVEGEPFEAAKAIETEIVSSEAYGNMSLVEVRVPFAARHQVRAQLAALRHPIAGDELYGGETLPGLTRHFLHASVLAFPHPSTGKQLSVEAPLPDELRAVLEALR